MELSDRIKNIEESGTVCFTPLIQRLRENGKDIINLAIGEPAFKTPPSVINATKKALDLGMTRYSPVAGIFDLKVKIAELYDGYAHENILISNGSKHSLYTAFQTILNPGDEVILIRPCWSSFSQQVKLAGSQPVFVNSKKNQLDINAIEDTITKKTKAIVLNSPNNPTGAVYPIEDLNQIAMLSLAYNFYIISDETYAAFVYDGGFHESIFSIKEVRDKTLVTGSFSKSFNMTGFRVGYLAAEKNIIDAAEKLQGHITGNVCTFAQYGAYNALKMSNKFLDTSRVEFENKRNTAYQYATKFFKCIKPNGAFYLFPNVARYLRKNETSEDLAISLLTQKGVAVIPGEAFGVADHIRISFAVSDEDLEIGFDKIRDALRLKGFRI